MVSEYTIKEALAELNISKATLYYRINKYKRKIEPHILMKNGKKFISRQGIEILMVNCGAAIRMRVSVNQDEIVSLAS